MAEYHDFYYSMFPKKVQGLFSGFHKVFAEMENFLQPLILKFTGLQNKPHTLPLLRAPHCKTAAMSASKTAATGSVLVPANTLWRLPVQAPAAVV